MPHSNVTHKKIKLKLYEIEARAEKCMYGLPMLLSSIPMGNIHIVTADYLIFTTCLLTLTTYHKIIITTIGCKLNIKGKGSS